MAFIIPETLSTQPSSATPGERKVFVALRDHLPEDYLVYYDISVRGRHPDFIIVAPDRALRNGPGVEIRRCASIEDSRQHALQWIGDRLARGIAAEEILVLGLARPEMKTFTTRLNSLGVPACLLGRTTRAEGVRVSTIHSSKGLDADCVALLDAHQLQEREDPEARRLLYIAMTRAKQDLCVFYHRDSALMAELERACAGGSLRL